MARLKNPAAGTVVNVEGDLEVTYRARGWVDVVKPKPRRKTVPEE